MALFRVSFFNEINRIKTTVKLKSVKERTKEMYKQRSKGGDESHYGNSCIQEKKKTRTT
jgi:hypothetical protein